MKQATKPNHRHRARKLTRRLAEEKQARMAAQKQVRALEAELLIRGAEIQVLCEELETYDHAMNVFRSVILAEEGADE